jgi:hypothetical protein
MSHPLLLLIHQRPDLFRDGLDFVAYQRLQTAMSLRTSDRQKRGIAFAEPFVRILRRRERRPRHVSVEADSLDGWGGVGRTWALEDFDHFLVYAGFAGCCYVRRKWRGSGWRGAVEDGEYGVGGCAFGCHSHGAGAGAGEGYVEVLWGVSGRSEDEMNWLDRGLLV